MEGDEGLDNSLAGCPMNARRSNRQFRPGLNNYLSSTGILLAYSSWRMAMTVPRNAGRRSCLPRAGGWHRGGCQWV